MFAKIKGEVRGVIERTTANKKKYYQLALELSTNGLPEPVRVNSLKNTRKKGEMVEMEVWANPYLGKDGKAYLSIREA